MLSSIDVILSGAVHGEASVRLGLLDDDVRSVQIAYEDFLQAKQRVCAPGQSCIDLEDTARMFHHAKTFVVAMRRVGRMAEGLSANRDLFPPACADAIKLAWRKKSAFFATYVDPRNAIEHIEGELVGQANYLLMYMHGDALAVAQGKRADITAEAVATAVALREEVVAAVLRHRA